MRTLGVIPRSRQLARVLRTPLPGVFGSAARVSASQLDDLAIGNGSEFIYSLPPPRCFHSATLLSGNTHESSLRIELNHQNDIMQITSSSSMMMQSRLFSSEARATGNESAETVKEVYEKMLNCVAEKRSAPPNAWMWSLIAKCSTHEDIKLLFDILQKLRTFRLSNLRIHDDFNSALCREVAKACVRAGAIDFGKKTLWKHNLYGLNPDIGSAHLLLLHAKRHNDVKLMVEVMKLVKTNDLPLQPGTADIVFSICYSRNRWDLICKYGKRFVKSGVKLRQTSFDLWMEFAAKKGDVDSLAKVEKWRSEATKQHSLSTGFSCAKGFVLNHKPENAAAVLQVLYQTLSEARRPSFAVELQKLASQWPLEVIKNQKTEDRESFGVALQNDISKLVNTLQSLGVEADVTMQDFTEKEAGLS